MGVRVEWLDARELLVETYSPSEDWIGSDQQEGYVLTISDGSGHVTAIEGERRDLNRVAAQIYVAVYDLLLSERGEA